MNEHICIIIATTAFLYDTLQLENVLKRRRNSEKKS